jgi:hypothetical protein
LEEKVPPNRKTELEGSNFDGSSKSWSIRNIQQEFRGSNYMVQTATKLVAEKESLSNPT